MSDLHSKALSCCSFVVWVARAYSDGRWWLLYGDWYCRLLVRWFYHGSETLLTLIGEFDCWLCEVISKTVRFNCRKVLPGHWFLPIYFFFFIYWKNGLSPPTCQTLRGSWVCWGALVVPHRFDMEKPGGIWSLCNTFPAFVSTLNANLGIYLGLLWVIFIDNRFRFG